MGAGGGVGDMAQKSEWSTGGMTRIHFQRNKRPKGQTSGEGQTPLEAHRQDGRDMTLHRAHSQGLHSLV